MSAAEHEPSRSGSEDLATTWWDLVTGRATFGAPQVRRGAGRVPGSGLVGFRDDRLRHGAIEPGMRVLQEQLILGGALNGGHETGERVGLAPPHVGGGATAVLGQDARIPGVGSQGSSPPGYGSTPERLPSITFVEWSFHHSTWARTSLRVQPSMSGAGPARASSSSAAAAASMRAWVSRIRRSRVFLSMRCNLRLGGLPRHPWDRWLPQPSMWSSDPASAGFPSTGWMTTIRRCCPRPRPDRAAGSAGSGSGPSPW